MRVRVLAMFLLLIVCRSVHAADVTWDPSWGCDAESSGSECDALVGEDNGDGGGGKYAYCIARKSQGQQCQDVVTIYTDPDTLCATGCRVCASVNFSASCSCDGRTLTLTGSCTYW